MEELAAEGTAQRSLIDDMRPQLETTDLDVLSDTMCTSKADIRKLETVVKRVRKLLDPEQWRDLQEEIREIKEDNRWVGTKRGRYVLAINEWMAPFYDEFQAIPAFQDVLIGGHAAKEVVFVAAKLQNKRIMTISWNLFSPRILRSRSWQT